MLPDKQGSTAQPEAVTGHSLHSVILVHFCHQTCAAEAGSIFSLGLRRVCSANDGIDSRHTASAQETAACIQTRSDSLHHSVTVFSGRGSAFHTTTAN